MKPIYAFVFFFCLYSGTASVAFGHKQKKQNNSGQRTTLAAPAEDNYDVKHLKFDIHLSDTSVYVSGNVATTAQVVAASMTTYVFELDSSLAIDSAIVNGVACSISRSGVVSTVTLPGALSAGTTFTAQIYYHGLPPGGGGGFFNGITHAVTSGGTNVVYTISDPYVALNWWPCKQSILDKIDSVDMYVTVPQGVVDGSNGLLLNVDSTTNPGFWQYHWQTHYAIDYYLISVAIARYSVYNFYVHFAASSDSMLIQNFFMDTATFNPRFKINFDSIPIIMNYFCSLYGRYPFWKEKYGVCYSTLPGGMEHQTMTTIGVPSTYIIAHEMCHQWFGDHVTYSTWRDVWLSEGFATFSEQLFLNNFWGPAAALAHRQAYLSYIYEEPCGMLSVNDTIPADSLFDPYTVYAKGQGVIRMLQYIAPSDSIFFQALRTYQQTYSFGNANTNDLKAIFETYYGVSLDSFFTQWIYGHGYPQYQVSWDQVGSSVFVKLVQIPSCPSLTPHFNTPLELQLHSAAGDTIIRVYNSLDTETYVFNWTPTMSTVYLNPDVWTVCAQWGAIRKDPTLATGSVVPANLKIYPNPSATAWQITDLPEGLSLTVCDVAGRAVWQGRSKAGTNSIPCQKLLPGQYVLKVGDGQGEQSLMLSRL